MDIRYSCNQRDFKRYTTEEIRQEFLMENLYVPDEVVSVYSHVDRMITLGCMPVWEAVPLEKGLDVCAALGTEYFLERREGGCLTWVAAALFRWMARAIHWKNAIAYILREAPEKCFSAARTPQILPSFIWYPRRRTVRMKRAA